MARLLPDDFDLDALEHSEQRVCRAFLEGLDDSWIVVPSVPLVVDGQDAEIDVVLVSPTHGVVVVETKGGVISIDQGRWQTNGHPLKRSPIQQAAAGKYALIARMASANLDTEGLFVVHVAALPDVGSIPEDGLGLDAPADRLLSKIELADPQDFFDRTLRVHSPIPQQRLAALLRLLRRDVVLDGSEGGVLRWAKRQLDDETCVHLASVRGLDTNRRVLVTGGAGTGKTMLALDWAVRALDRGERTLVVCFNKPIAEYLQRSLEGTSAMVGTYHDVALRLLDPSGFRIGERPTPEYWLDVPTEALAFHASAIGTPFDTIVIDEGQDFYPHWFASLERLLDPAGPRRLLLTADQQQALYVKPWSPPPDMFEAPLVYNLRNCSAIADLVRRLGGPAPLPSAPSGDAVEFLAAGGQREVRKRVRDCIERLTNDHGVPFGDIAVLTFHTADRDALLTDGPDGCPLVRWEERSEHAVLCETVHRTKGLERTAVILVDRSDDPDPMVLYVGASRAVASLRLVGSPALALAAGLD